jgi:hypothetical protein
MLEGSCLCGAVTFRVTGAKIAIHIFTAEKGDYYDIPEDEPQHPR